MARRITVNLTDDQAVRLSALADCFDCSPVDLAGGLLLEAIQSCEDDINSEACEQIAWLAAVEPQGRA
jgi:hypothetical protein